MFTLFVVYLVIVIRQRVSGVNSPEKIIKGDWIIVDNIRSIILLARNEIENKSPKLWIHVLPKRSFLIYVKK